VSISSDNWRVKDKKKLFKIVPQIILWLILEISNNTLFLLKNLHCFEVLFSSLYYKLWAYSPMFVIWSIQLWKVGLFLKVFCCVTWTLFQILYYSFFLRLIHLLWLLIFIIKRNFEPYTKVHLCSVHSQTSQSIILNDLD
jgi:hypothetical protein